MTNKYKYKVIIGGNCMGSTLVLSERNLTTVRSNECEVKSDWEELAQICSSAARKYGLTKEDSRRILKSVRSMDEGNC